MKRKILYLSHMHYIWDQVSNHNIIGTNPVATSMIKKYTILLGKNKNAKFDVTDYQRLVRKPMHLL